MATYLALNA